MTRAYSTADWWISDGVPIRPSSSGENQKPAAATAMLTSVQTLSVVPVTLFIFPTSPVPQAWPTSTIPPLIMPMRKETTRKKIGKNTEATASAERPSNCPK